MDTSLFDQHQETIHGNISNFVEETMKPYLLSKNQWNENIELESDKTNEYPDENFDMKKFKNRVRVFNECNETRKLV